MAGTGWRSCAVTVCGVNVVEPLCSATTVLVRQYCTLLYGRVCVRVCESVWVSESEWVSESVSEWVCEWVSEQVSGVGISSHSDMKITAGTWSNCLTLAKQDKKKWEH